MKNGFFSGWWAPSGHTVLQHYCHGGPHILSAVDGMSLVFSVKDVPTPLLTSPSTEHLTGGAL